jgi:hypothetical protein
MAFQAGHRSTGSPDFGSLRGVSKRSGRRLLGIMAVLAAAVFLVSVRAPLAQAAGMGTTAGCMRQDHTFLNLVWSPDGRQIAWTSSCNGAWDAQVWMASANGSNPRLVAREIAFVSQLAWLRAAGLVYTGVSSLWHLSQSGSKTLLVAHSDGQFTANTAGDRVAWGVAGCECQGPVVVKSLAGGWTRTVAGNEHFGDFDPTLSPDGRRVAFVRSSCPQFARCDRGAGIWVSSIAGGRPRQITKSGYSPE